MKQYIMKQYSDEVKRFAAAYHTLTCVSNHTDYCGWFYGEKSRSYEYADAEKMLSNFNKIGISIEQLEQLALLRFPSRKDWLFSK